MFQILVVEDDTELRDLFCTVLMDNGYTAVPAADGLAAFDILDNTNIDLVIIHNLPSGKNAVGGGY